MTPESLRRLADLLEADPTLEVRDVHLVRSVEPRHPLTATERSAKRRAKERLEARERAENSTNSTVKERVSPRTPSERNHASGSDLAQKEPESGSGSPEIRSESVRARADATHARPASVPVLLDDEHETVVPLNLLERAEEMGVFRDMLTGMPGVTPEQLRDSAREFMTYWTIGAGMGRRRRLWMAKLREHLRRAFHENRLNAPGAIEHAARNGRTVRQGETPQRNIRTPADVVARLREMENGK